MSSWLQEPYEPQETSDVDRAFPADFVRLMPAPEAIPEAYWTRDTPFAGFTMHAMTTGWTTTAQFAPREGIDAEKAFWHLQCLIGSFGPKHQHKEATVNFLAERWFYGVRDGDRLLFGEDWTAADENAGSPS